MANPLTEYRAAQKPQLSQTELARKLGISRAHVCRIEGGSRKPSGDLLVTIKEQLGIAPNIMRPDLASLMESGQ